MVLSPKHRFTVADFYRMTETGVLRPEARVELLDGDVIDMPSDGPFHKGVAARLTRWFTGNSKTRWLVWPHNAVRLNEHTELRPDLCLLKTSPGDYASRLPRAEEIFLIVEIADAASEFEREEKLPAYSRAGVAEVWLANLTGQTIEVFWDASISGYNANAVLRIGDKAAPLAFQDAAVNIGELFSKLD